MSIQHWLSFHLGFTNGSGVWYLFWSGFGSDLTEFAILFAIFKFFRHANCHTKGCWRFGKPLDGTAYRLCHHHHPDHAGEKRNVPLDTILSAHAKAHPVRKVTKKASTP